MILITILNNCLQSKIMYVNFDGRIDLYSYPQSALLENNFSRDNICLNETEWKWNGSKVKSQESSYVPTVEYFIQETICHLTTPLDRLSFSYFI